MRKLYLIFLWWILIFPGAVSAQAGYNTLLYEGNKAFKSKNYDRAASKFSEAAKVKTGDFAAHYNLGNSFYQKKMYAEASAEYAKAESLAKSAEDRMAALYNLGNTFMQTKSAAKAAEAYRKALKQDPYNEYARKNYQIALLKEKEKQQQQNGKQNNGGGKNGKNPKQQSNDPAKGQQQNGQGNQQQGTGGQGSQPKENKTGNNSGMPKELQDALMRRAEDRERETARRILNKNGYSVPPSNEKDW